MEKFTKEELRWIIKQAKQKQKTAVGKPLLTKVFEIERKAFERLTIPVVSNSFCFHTMTRNPKEHQENRCRLCKKPYKK